MVGLYVSLINPKRQEIKKSRKEGSQPIRIGLCFESRYRQGKGQKTRAFGAANEGKKGYNWRAASYPIATSLIVLCATGVNGTPSAFVIFTTVSKRGFAPGESVL